MKDKHAVLVSEREFVDQVKRLRNKDSRDEAIANLLDSLGRLMVRSGWNLEGRRVRIVARDMNDAIQEDRDFSGLGHDDTRQLAASVTDRYLQRTTK